MSVITYLSASLASQFDPAATNAGDPLASLESSLAAAREARTNFAKVATKRSGSFDLVNVRQQRNLRLDQAALAGAQRNLAFATVASESLHSIYDKLGQARKLVADLAASGNPVANASTTQASLDELLTAINGLGTSTRFAGKNAFGDDPVRLAVLDTLTVMTDPGTPYTPDTYDPVFDADGYVNFDAATLNQDTRFDGVTSPTNTVTGSHQISLSGESSTENILLPETYTVTNNSYIEFEFQADEKGVYFQGIALDSDGTIYDGSGLIDATTVGGKWSPFSGPAIDYTAGDGWVSYRVKLTNFMTLGDTFDRLVLSNNDYANPGSPGSSTSEFRNIRFTEGTDPAVLGFTPGTAYVAPTYVTYDNPAAKGRDFSMSGLPDMNVKLGSMRTADLGNDTHQLDNLRDGGSLDMATLAGLGNFSAALTAIDDAMNEVALQASEIDAFAAGVEKRAGSALRRLDIATTTFERAESIESARQTAQSAREQLRSDALLAKSASFEASVSNLAGALQLLQPQAAPMSPSELFVFGPK